MASQQRQHQWPQLLPFAIPLECLQELGCMLPTRPPSARSSVLSSFKLRCMSLWVLLTNPYLVTPCLKEAIPKLNRSELLKIVGQQAAEVTLAHVAGILSLESDVSVRRRQVTLIKEDSAAADRSDLRIVSFTHDCPYTLK